MLTFSSVLIGVRDLEKARPLYEKLLGITFDEFRPPYSMFVFDGVTFNLEEDADYRPREWARMYIGGRKSVNFETDNLAGFLSKAKEIGARIVHEPKEQPWGWREAVIADLDGNEFIVEEKMSVETAESLSL